MVKIYSAVEKRTHPHYDNLNVFVADTGYKLSWYSRIYLNRKEGYKESSLRLPFVSDKDEDYEAAFEKALPIYFDVTKRKEQGFSVTRKSFSKVARAFQDLIKKQAEENEERITAGMAPIHRTFGRKTFWKMEHSQHIDWVISELILPFFQLKPNLDKSIEAMTETEIEEWQFWRLAYRAKELRKDWSPGTINKQNRVMRQIFTYAKQERLIRFVPEIKDEPENPRERRIPAMEKGHFEQLLAWVESGYRNSNRNERDRLYNRLFYLWLVTIDAAGYRPPKNTIKNLLKWSDITREFDKDGNVTYIGIHRNDEKGLGPYIAIPDKHWTHIYDDLRAIHEAYDMDTDYVFAHPMTYGEGVKNEPITQGFRTQWRNAMKHFGWAKKYAKRQERYAPYSLRHRFVTRKMLENPDMKLSELAQITGTREQNLFNTYWHFKAELKYNDYTGGGYQQKPDLIRLRDDKGILMGFADRDSKEHREWYAKYKNTDKPSKASKK